MIPTTDTNQMNKEPAMYAVFHDLEPTKAEHWYSLSGQQSVSAMWSKQKYEAWRDIPSTYVHCLNDRVIPPDFQAQMVRNAKDIQPNAFDVEERLRCGHNPVLSNVGDLVAILKKAAGQ
ncbi:hypothetical protein EV356DRAFT_507857 [Viridothelium virens]|uniref:AB hydrolase-1 domain-containing protein n=1 Tax=Viridothelium virens TaxID=1048519 RepID=A0A6A6GZI2_VIRVR|nr:hypothetical protein EV356DRAFT_507857 [Viridothelium virens]